jgi:hypothetical protein
VIKLLKDGKTLSFTGKDYKLVNAYAKEHKLTFKQTVYLALMNGIAAGNFNKNSCKKETK